VAAPLYLGLDVGTQGTKGLLYDAEARRTVARASHAYDLLPGLPEGAAEQHPDTWRDAVRRVVARLLTDSGARPDSIRALAISGQQHGFVPLDADHRVLRPAKLWCDTSTDREARELSERLGRHVPTGFTASKVLWLKYSEPDSFARLAHALLPHDWIDLWLTGRVFTEAGDASGTGYFDPVRRAYDEEAVAAIDDDLHRALPPLVEPGEVAGELTPEAAHELGLAPGTRVAVGGGDNMMSAIGAGATSPGRVVVSLGTSGTAFTFSPTPVVDPEGLIAPFCDSTGGWLPLLCTMNVTGVTEEVRAAFGLGSDADLDAVTAAAEQVAPGSEGLLLLPYLQGERVPDLPRASGTLLGIRSGNLRPATLFRAAIEGTTLNLAWGVERLKGLGVTVDRVRLVGGGSRSRLWARVLSGALGVPVEPHLEPESAALGAALQALWTDRRAEGEGAAANEVAEAFGPAAEDAVEATADETRAYRDLLVRFRAAVERQHGA